MNLSDKEQTFLVRGLDKSTTPDEAYTCAKNFFKELRARGAESYEILAQLDAGEDFMPYEFEGTPEFEEARAYWDYVGHENWKRQNEAREKGIPFQWCNVTVEEFRKWYDANKDASGRVPPPSPQKPGSWGQNCAGVARAVQAVPKPRENAQTPPQRPPGPGNGHVGAGGPPPTQGPRPGAGHSGRSAVAEMPTGKFLFLLVLSFAIAFLCFHGIFASLIFGLLLAVPMIGSRWFRRALGLIGLIIVGFFCYILLYELNYHIKEGAEFKRRAQAIQQAKAQAQLETVQVPQAVALEQRTASWPTPTPVPIAKKDWRELMPDNPYAYKAPGHDPRNELQSNFIAGTRAAERDPDLAKVEADPKMQEISKQTGASVKDLLLFREMMLDRYGPHYEDDDA